MAATEGLPIEIEPFSAEQQESQSWEPARTCQGCFAACCREGIIIPLTSKEAANLRENGGQLTEFMSDGPKAGWRRKFYKMEADCPNLDQESQLCTAYEDRPRACREFRAGSFTCASMQRGQLERDLDLVSIAAGSSSFEVSLVDQ